jgi:hypothetical protein
MRTTARLLLASAIAVAASACNGNSSGSASLSAKSTAGAYAGHGTSINPIDFSVANGVVSGVHGMVSVNCVSAPSTNIVDSQFVDADNIRVDGSGDFSDDYHYKVGDGDWTLHVNGRLYGNGTAAGYLYVRGVGCSTPTDGWAAAVKGAALPAVPTAAPTSPAAGCSPQPCAKENGVTVSVQGAVAVTKSDDASTKGVDVTFSVVNNGSTGVGIINADYNFLLKFGNGDTAEHSYDHFVDSSGEDVPCLRTADAVNVLPGQQVTDQHICFVLPHDETGQQMSFIWNLSSPPFVVAVGALQ